MLSVIFFLLVQTTLVSTRGNILVIDTMPASSQSRNLIEMANGLALDGFNVTVLGAYDAMLPSTQNLHLHKIPLPSEEIFPKNVQLAAEREGYSHAALFVLDRPKVLAKLLLNERADVIESLRDTKFDSALTGLQELDTMIASALNITSIRYLNCVPQPLTAKLAQAPAKLSILHPILIPFESILRGFSKGSIPYRLFGILDYLVMVSIFPDTEAIGEFMHSNYEDVKKQVGTNFIIGSGVEGALMDAVQLPSNLASVYPLTSYTSKHNIDMNLTEEYEKFLEKFENIVLIAFGTTFRPSEEIQLALTDMIKKTPSVGFIWSLKEKDTKFDEIQAMQLSNLLLKTFVPQKQLMNHPKTKAFVSHGGANSLLESLYYGLPVFGMPFDVDQYTNIAKLEKQNAGFYITNPENLEELQKKLLDFLSDKNHSLRQGVQKIQKMLEFQEERSSRNLTYWIDHQQRFGMDHLRSKYHKVSVIALYDLDIIAMLVGPPLGLILLILLCCSFTGRKRILQKPKQ